MDVHQLDIFLAVLETNGATRAAQKVNLTPGAVSLQIQKLSAEVHAQLFVREGRRLAPTPAALRLAEHARRVVKQVRLIEQDFESDPRGDDRPFRFATGVTTLVYRMGRPLRRLRRQFPRCDFHVWAGATEDILTGLHNRQFDLGLISLPVPEEHLEITQLFEEELLLLRPSATAVRAGAVTSIDPRELNGVPFLLYTKRSNMRSKIDAFLKEAGVVPRVLMEADDTECIKRLVESGFGYSILPEHALRGHRRFFHVHRIGHKRLVRRKALAMARTDFPRQLTVSIAAFLKSAMGEPRAAGEARAASA